MQLKFYVEEIQYTPVQKSTSSFILPIKIQAVSSGRNPERVKSNIGNQPVEAHPKLHVHVVCKDDNYKSLVSMGIYYKIPKLT